MKEKILLASLRKIFDLASKDLTCPSSANLESISKDEISSLYVTSWSLICDIHDLAFKASQTCSLLDTIESDL